MMETLLVERDAGIVTVTLNRPEKKNAANGQMWDELLETFLEIADTAADRVVVVTGAGGAFCSGADLNTTDGVTRNGLARMRHIATVALALHHLPKPTIAKVGGVAVGAGANLALGCDVVVASEEARFAQIFARRGMSLDFGGSWLLPRLVGLHKAKELTLLAEMIDAEEAARIGIVNRVVPAAELDAFVDDWARRISAMPPVAVSLSKSMLNNSFASSMDQALEDEARSQAVNFGTKDFSEAIRAFLEKREPHFSGE
jgi:2-(1,2-epoxy-1,2-dihydrophenyl)acetyl-CoA isomerase